MNPVNVPTLSSIAAIVVATLFSVQVVKRLCVDLGPRMAWFGRVPTWIVAVVIAAIYTAVANLWWHTLDGSLGTLMWQAVFNAAITSGFYEWFRNVKTPVGKTTNDEGDAFVDPRKNSTDIQNMIDEWKQNPRNN